MADPSRLSTRALAGDPPPPGTRVVVARIAGEAQQEEADRVAKALVGLRGAIAEPDGDGPTDERTATVKLDGAESSVTFAWTELELEENYKEE